MLDSWLESIKSMGIFLICAQTLLHFKPKGEYEKYIKLLVSIMLLVQLLEPIGLLLGLLNKGELQEKIRDMEQKITIEEFNEETQELNYIITKGTYISSIVSIGVYILYFVVFQAYNNGQTFGKKLFKIQVLKENDRQVDMNTLLIRCLIPYGVLVNFILVVMILFVSQSFYINTSSILSSIHTIVIFITLVMMAIKSKGIHDYLSKTKVVEV